MSLLANKQLVLVLYSNLFFLITNQNYIIINNGQILEILLIFIKAKCDLILIITQSLTRQFATSSIFSLPLTLTAKLLL